MCPKSVEGHVRHALDAPDLPVPHDAQIVRLDRGAVRVAEHQSVGMAEQIAAVISEISHGSGRERNLPSPMLRLRLLEPEACLGLFQADRSTVRTLPSISPHRRARSSPSRHPLARPEAREWPEPVAPQSVPDGPDLFRSQYLDFIGFQPWRRSCVSHVAGEKL